jgi:hypothetical protein
MTKMRRRHPRQGRGSLSVGGEGVTPWPLFYVLEGHDAVPLENGESFGVREAEELCRSIGRRVAHDEIGEVVVSTVFLGLSAQHREGPPLVFETLVFPRNDVRRYSTWDEALEGHGRIVAAVRAGAWEEDVAP